LLGGQTVHLEFTCYSKGWKFCHVVCQSKVSEDEAYDLSRSEEYEKTAKKFENQEDMRLSHSRHSSCWGHLQSVRLLITQGEATPEGNKLHLEFLRTCRQAFIEANRKVPERTPLDPRSLRYFRANSLNSNPLAYYNLVIPEGFGDVRLFVGTESRPETAHEKGPFRNCVEHSCPQLDSYNSNGKAPSLGCSLSGLSERG
jgi:hypothetical protein